MQINDIVYRPCSMDIIPFKVIGIRSYEDHSIYEAQATGNVGACGKVKVLLTYDKKQTARFIGLSNDFSSEYDSGLGDFVEGIYYTDKLEARLVYNETHRLTFWSTVERKKRELKEAEANYNKVVSIITGITEEIKEQSCKYLKSEGVSETNS